MTNRKKSQPFSGYSHDNSVLLIGGTTRSAAESARRAGLLPVCFDEFVDADLQCIANAGRIEDIETLQTHLGSLPRLPFLYTGGWENIPASLEAVMQRHRLQGVPPRVLHGLRDPFVWTAALENAGIPTLPLRRQTDPPPPDGHWLSKQHHSCGGLGVRIWDVNSNADRTTPPSATDRQDPRERNDKLYFQRRVVGSSYSALCLADDQGRVQIIGYARQWSRMQGEGTSFHWAGAIAPVDIGRQLEEQFERIAKQLAATFPLVGLFGLDFIVGRKSVSKSGNETRESSNASRVQNGGSARNAADQSAWLMEINPRYTATTELHELAGRRNLLKEHLEVCAGRSLTGLHLSEPDDGQPLSLCKQIVYATGKTRVIGDFLAGRPDVATSFPAKSVLRAGWLADCPSVGTVIEKNAPVCSVLWAIDRQAVPGTDRQPVPPAALLNRLSEYLAPA